YLNTLFFVEIIKIDKNSKKSLNFHRGICVGKTGLWRGFLLSQCGLSRHRQTPEIKIPTILVGQRERNRR
ncbi:hypothetical protein, partial [Vibrio fluvialis]|uniref:hypothetical protein n=1 Tax=Vibrio fluvialis TaxID=676 RepID=UPI001F1CCC17